MVYLRIGMKCTPEAQRLRSRMYEETRRFFTDAGYLEVEVPVLAGSLIPESHLEVFETAYLDLYQDPPGRVPLYLTPSPEVFLKRLLASDWPSLFSLSRAFRNAESRGRHHNPEFTMLEFYTRDADYIDSIDVTERWIAHVSEALEPEVAAYRSARRRDPHGAFLRAPFARTTVDELMRRYAGFPANWARGRETLIAAARDAGMAVDPAESFEAVFNRAFVHFVEPELAERPAALVMDYPAEIPTLARRKEAQGAARGGAPPASSPSQPSGPPPAATAPSPWAQRWELYLFGLEVANCYTEATHPDEVREFFDSERQRSQSNLIVHPVDGEYPGLFDGIDEPISGVAVGMERLLMAFLGAKEIEEVLVFPMNSML